MNALKNPKPIKRWDVFQRLVLEIVSKVSLEYPHAVDLSVKDFNYICSEYSDLLALMGERKVKINEQSKRLHSDIIVELKEDLDSIADEEIKKELKRILENPRESVLMYRDLARDLNVEDSTARDCYLDYEWGECTEKLSEYIDEKAKKIGIQDGLARYILEGQLKNDHDNLQKYIEEGVYNEWYLNDRALYFKFFSCSIDSLDDYKDICEKYKDFSITYEGTLRYLKDAKILVEDPSNQYTLSAAIVAPLMASGFNGFLEKLKGASKGVSRELFKEGITSLFSGVALAVGKLALGQ